MRLEVEQIRGRKQQANNQGTGTTWWGEGEVVRGGTGGGRGELNRQA